MSKNLLILSVVVIVAVVGVGGYFLLNSNSNLPGNQENQTDSMSQDDKAQMDGKKMAFSDFINQGGSYQCTVNQSVNGQETHGTTYIDSGMIRGEFNTQTQGVSFDASFIVRDGYTYSWSSSLPGLGFKAALDKNTDSDTSAGTSGQYSFDASQIGDYDCQAWVADQSKFEIPSGINFQTVN